jgi:hypothetical protein
VRRVAHLAGRFVTSLRPRRVDDADRLWVQHVLAPAELACWDRLGTADRAESVGVARRTAQALGPDGDTRWLAAALLHDIGKTATDLGTIGRAAATVAAAVASHGRARHWGNAWGRYVAHDDLGAAVLEAAGPGVRPEVIAWARVHHRPEQWAVSGIPADICALLARADGER